MLKRSATALRLHGVHSSASIPCPPEAAPPNRCPSPSPCQRHRFLPTPGPSWIAPVLSNRPPSSPEWLTIGGSGGTALVPSAEQVLGPWQPDSRGSRTRTAQA